MVADLVERRERGVDADRHEGGQEREVQDDVAIRPPPVVRGVGVRLERFGRHGRCDRDRPAATERGARTCIRPSWLLVARCDNCIVRHASFRIVYRSVTRDACSLVGDGMDASRVSSRSAVVAVVVAIERDRVDAVAGTVVPRRRIPRSADRARLQRNRLRRRCAAVLAWNPDVDLLAVTLPGTGEADCEPGTRTTRALLELSDRADVAIGCGSDERLGGDRDWPEAWRSEANRLRGSRAAERRRCAGRRRRAVADRDPRRRARPSHGRGRRSAHEPGGGAG